MKTYFTSERQTMRDNQRILQTCETLNSTHANDSQFAIATVAMAEGSAYRRHGARMLVLPDGKRVGSISGGCLESDVVAHAVKAIRSGVPEFVLYDSQISNSDLILELGCKGAVGILIEPGNSPSVQSVLGLFSTALKERRSSAIATVFQSQHSSLRMSSYVTLHDNGNVEGDLADSPLSCEILADLNQVLKTGRACSKTYAPDNNPRENEVNVLLEPIEPPIALTLCGAGQDALPLIEMARALGWQTTVVDHRKALLTQERFPGAKLLHCSYPDSSFDLRISDARTAVVIMTHNYEQDKAILAAILSSPVRYLGLVGPRERGEKIQRELRESEVHFDDQFLRKLYSPAGLDIGAEPSEGIALAILSEIQAVFSEREGGFLRHRVGSIHLPVNPYSAISRHSVLGESE